MNKALKPEDYTITVENNPCPVKELASSYLRCDLTETINNHNLFEEKAVLTITVRIWMDVKDCFDILYSVHLCTF